MSLLALPEALVDLVLSFVTIDDITRCSLTCKVLLNECEARGKFLVTRLRMSIKEISSTYGRIKTCSRNLRGHIRFLNEVCTDRILLLGIHALTHLPVHRSTG